LPLSSNHWHHDVRTTGTGNLPNFQELRVFQKQNGHGLVPISYTTNGINLGAWVSTQRREYRSKKLFADRQKKLEELGFTWNIKN
jgi:hypothetical protein